MLFDRNSAKSSNSDSEHTFPAIDEPIKTVLLRKFRLWWAEYTPLFEAASVAVSAHILAFPIVWFVGWALPWPKGPEITTIIEFDLTNWPDMAVPVEITDIFESQKKGGYKKTKKK